MFIYSTKPNKQDNIKKDAQLATKIVFQLVMSPRQLK